MELQLAWSRDLATVEQRKNPSGLRWKVIPPSVRLLQPVGENMLLAGTHQHLQLIEASSGNPIRDLIESENWHSGMNRQYLTTPGGQVVFAEMQRTIVRKLPDADLIFECRHDSRAASTAVSPDGRRLAVLSWDGVLHVYAPEDRAELFRLPHERPKKAEDGSCAVTADGMRAVSSWPGSARFWDLESGKLIREHRNKHAGVRITGDGMEAITRGGIGYVLWNMETGKKIRNINGVTNTALGHHLISPNNRYVCEVAPFKLHAQRGDVFSVREWTMEDAPYTDSGRVDFAWLSDDQLSTWKNIVNEEGMATCEIRLWTLDPLKLITTALAVPPLSPGEHSNQTSPHAVQFFRVATAFESGMVFAGDGNAHVYGFRIKA